MNTAADRLDFAPPPTPGLMRALLLAIVAHALLTVALTAGLSWKHEAELVSAEAELWSSVPSEAAPKLIEPPPSPAMPPTRAVEPPPPPRVTDAEIAIERAKEKRLAAEKRLAELETKRKEALAAQEKARQLEAQRQENLKRLTGMANASGSSSATGAAVQSTGPSASYGAKLEARIRPNIVFSDEIAGNPRAVVLFSAAPDGTIVGKPRLKTTSGVKAWDDAVLRAIEKTESIPRDTDGRVPPLIEMGFTPKKQAN